MNSNGSTTGRLTGDWQSLQVRTSASGYRVREDARRFRSEVRSEIALRFTGIATLLSGWFMWLLPAGPVADAAMWSKVVLSATFGSVGLALFLWANRGFRREIRADVRRCEIRICKLNARGQALVTERVSMAKIDSMYVHRYNSGDGMATLEIRIAGRKPMPVMRGSEDELIALHRMLCRDMNTANMRALRPIAVSRVTMRRPVPNSLFGNRAQPA